MLHQGSASKPDTSAMQDRPDYKHCAEVAQKVADLLSPQSGAYYDVWLDGEKFMSRTIEVQP